MRILDRYVLRQFLQSFLICFLSLAGLYVVFDAFTNLEDFIACAQKQGTHLLALIGSYYSFQTLLFFDRTSGLMTLIAAMFTVSWLQRHNEIVAMQSAGISRVRVVAPIIGAAVVLSACSAASREMVIPRFHRELSQRPRDLTSGRELAPRYDNRTDVLIRGKAAFADEKRISEPDFLLPPALDRYGKQLMAEDAFYKPPESGRPGGYLLAGVTLPEQFCTRPTLTLGDKPVVITPRDAPDWLRPDQCFLVSELTFEQLTAGSTWRQLSSTCDLISGLQNDALGFGADVRVTIHARIVRPLLDVTLLFLGLPLVLTRQNRNVFIAMGLCAVVVSVVSMVVIGFQYLGTVYSVTPVLAAWAPLLVFVPAAVAAADSMWQ